MSELPLASVIIDNYNYARFLPQAIESALNQDYPRIEVIVVDDGSTDHSADLIKAYGERVIPVLKDNGGQGSAFNAGFAASHGEIILFLDADDLLLASAVSNAAEMLRNPQVVRVQWPMSVIDENAQRLGKLQPSRPLAEGDLRKAVLQSGPISYVWAPTSGNAWTRAFIQAIAPVPEREFKNSVDMYWAALAPLFGLIKTIPEPQSLYRVHPGNDSARGFEEKLQLLLMRSDACLEAMAKRCRAAGIEFDADACRANSWWHQINRTVAELLTIVPAGASFILVDMDGWETGEQISGRRRIPFLERDGSYWGAPPDDATAIRELQRLQEAGAGFIAIAWPNLWFLEHFQEFRDYLRGRFNLVLENPRLVVFDLREPTRVAGPAPQEDIVTIANMKIRLGDHISPDIRDSISAGGYEHGELHALQAMLAPGDIVMELGTGLGFLSAYCAQIVGSESVYTFEANPALEPHIRDTFTLNNVAPNLEICVLADRAGDHDFYVSAAFWESSLLPLSDPVAVVSVPGKPVNDELARIKPTLLVIDIEGGEYDLFQYLDLASVRKMVIELHPHAIGIEKVRAVVSLLYRNGFRAIKEASSGDVLGLARFDQAAAVPGLTEAEAISNLDWTRIGRARDEINALVGPADAFILVDEQLFDFGAFGRRQRFFFPDRDGEYWGPPAEDSSAIEELERLRREGAKFMVFAWPAFWWLEHYAGLNDHLRSNFRVLAQNDQLIIFDLGTFDLDNLDLDNDGM